MSTVTTTRNVDLADLPFPATGTWDGTAGSVTADVAQATLASAVTAAGDASVKAQTQQANQTTIEERLDAGEAALLQIATSTGTLTSAQLSSAVRVLARAVLGLLKLARRRLTSTDGT